jgi:hypothetical protein
MGRDSRTAMGYMSNLGWFRWELECKVRGCGGGMRREAANCKISILAFLLLILIAG